MIVNFSQLLVKPRKFRDSIFFLLILAFFATWAYRLGAGTQAGQLSMLLQLMFIILAISYGVYYLHTFQRQVKCAIYLYEQYLDSISKTELVRILQHPDLTDRSRAIVDKTLQRRFPKRTL